MFRNVPACSMFRVLSTALRNLVLREIESISCILEGPSQMFDVQEALYIL